MKIAIAGYGVEGKSAYRYVRAAYPEAEITIYDQKPITDAPDGAALIIGDDVFAAIKANIVFRSPSINPRLLADAGEVTSVTKTFFEKCPTHIIGVTGTKGKGTTASLIHSILQAAGKKSWLVGNIGVPALDVLSEISAEDVVVYETSSFQLWDMDQSPHVAVVLMIEPDHLDVHKDFAEYIDAKSQIAIHQTSSNVLVFASKNVSSSHIADMSNAVKRPYQNAQYGHVADDFFFYNEQKLCSISSLKLPGKHNLDNACAAINAVWDYVQDGNSIAAGLAEFEGLPHRLKFVAEVGGVKYYDDSIATTPGSAIAAIRSFEQPKVIILGGYDKGADYKELIIECRNTQSSVIAIGANKQKIVELCAEIGVECGQEPGDMALIVRRASIKAKKGSVVILSPAAASFDMFKSYSDRGDQFVAAVKQLAA